MTHISLINRILSAPGLLEQVQRLPAPELLRIVNTIGIEDSAELLALASTEQLTRMVDEDLWQQEAPGQKENFRPDRLNAWIIALEEMGSEKAAAKLAEMDEEFLAFAFSQFLHAIDREALQFLYVRIQGDSWEDDRLEKLLENHNSQELAGALVLAKATAPWDSLLNLLLALDNHDNSLCGRLMHRLCLTTEAKAESEGGLFELLSQEEMLESDATHSRHLRRGQDGYVPAEDALALLEWIKVMPQETLLAMRGRDPVSRAYFREYGGRLLGAAAPSADSSLSPLLQEVLSAEPGAEAVPPLLLPGPSRPLSELMAGLDAADEERFRLELNFLAQVLLLTEGSCRPADAAQRVILLCEKGLKIAGADASGAVQLFALGWKQEGERREGR
jgi:hypothetical protein